MPVYGKGENVRDWLFVVDHAHAIDLIFHKGKAGSTYNIGGNNEKTNLEITDIILNQLNKPKTLIKFVEDRLGHDRRYAIDGSKIKKELGWEPKTKFEDGIKLPIDWYINNNEWIENLNFKRFNAF